MYASSVLLVVNVPDSNKIKVLCKTFNNLVCLNNCETEHLSAVRVYDHCLLQQ